MSSREIPAVSNNAIRIVLIGDIVGKPGIRMACDSVVWLRSCLKADCIVANAENAADGSGLRCKEYRRLVEHGIDGITLGDHVFRKREIMDVLREEENIVRPCNLPPEAPGRSHMVLELQNGERVAVLSALGRVFMKPVDCPFRAVDQQLHDIDDSVCIRLVDFHAEATSDMQVMGRYLDGRVTAVLGTHTHVATADEQIFPGGTGFQCDVGMTGPFESILGRRIEAVLEATLKSLPTPFQVSTSDVRLNATWLDADRDTGRCLQIGRIELNEAALGVYRSELESMRKIL